MQHVTLLQHMLCSFLDIAAVSAVRVSLAEAIYGRIRQECGDAHTYIGSGKAGAVSTVNDIEPVGKKDL